ncbi:MAG: substrate-binding domain-containing protein, partial [Candidatus Fermentibacteraceae bacterium]|nr:substrate-binding domain-containing protein [Candidatus Fermentibacteraceae bacterium]
MGRVLPIMMSVAFLVCCAGNEHPETAGNGGDRYRIGLAICMTPDTPFFVSLLEGAEESAQQQDVEIVPVYACEDPRLQSRQILDLAGEGIDAILLNPVSDSVIPALDSVISMGVPVFTIDRGVSSDRVVSHIASDNRAGGRMAGDYLAEALNRRGNVVEIMGTEGSSAAMERGLGFREAIAMHPDIEIVFSFHAGFDRNLAMDGFLDVLRDSVRVDGVFAHNDDMILGAMEAAGTAGTGAILFIGFDAI